MRTLLLLLAAQLADLAAYLLVGRPDDSIAEALGLDVPVAKLAGIALVLASIALLRHRRPEWRWVDRAAIFATLAGLVGAASGIRAVLA